jgi:hypothetical protein
MKLYEITRGEQVMSFSEYLHDPALGIQKKLIPLYEKLGDMLFKDGWDWGHGEFVKRPFTITYPLKPWKKAAKCMVRIRYSEKVASNGPGSAYIPALGASDTYDVADMVTNLQSNLDEVKAMATS